MARKIGMLTIQSNSYRNLTSEMRVIQPLPPGLPCANPPVAEVAVCYMAANPREDALSQSRLSPLFGDHFMRSLVVLAIDVVAHQPSGGAAHQHIGGEMLLAEDARNAHASGDGVCAELDPGRRILPGDCSSGRPGQHAMGGGKRGVNSGPTLEELASRVIRMWPLPPKNQLQALLHHHSIHRCFGAEDSGLRRMLISLEMTHPKQGYRSGDQSSGHHVRGNIV